MFSRLSLFLLILSLPLVAAPKRAGVIFLTYDNRLDFFVSSEMARELACGSGRGSVFGIPKESLLFVDIDSPLEKTKTEKETDLTVIPKQKERAGLLKKLEGASPLQKLSAMVTYDLENSTSYFDGGRFVRSSKFRDTIDPTKTSLATAVEKSLSLLDDRDDAEFFLFITSHGSKAEVCRQCGDDVAYGKLVSLLFDKVDEARKAKKIGQAVLNIFYDACHAFSLKPHLEKRVMKDGKPLYKVNLFVASAADKSGYGNLLFETIDATEKFRQLKRLPKKADAACGDLGSVAKYLCNLGGDNSHMAWSSYQSFDTVITREELEEVAFSGVGPLAEEAVSLLVDRLSKKERDQVKLLENLLASDNKNVKARVASLLAKGQVPAAVAQQLRPTLKKLALTEPTGHVESIMIDDLYNTFVSIDALEEILLGKDSANQEVREAAMKAFSKYLIKHMPAEMRESLDRIRFTS